MRVSMAEGNALAASNSFAAHIKTAPTLVFSAAVTWPALTTLPRTRPAAFSLRFPFRSPWRYTGTQDLLADFRYAGGTGQPYPLDLVRNADPLRWSEAHLPHEASHAVLAAGNPFGGQLFIHTRSAVGLPALVKDLGDQRAKPPVLGGPLALFSLQPGVEATPGDLQGLAHQAYFESPPVGPDEREPQSLFLAK